MVGAQRNTWYINQSHVKSNLIALLPFIYEIDKDIERSISKVH